MSQFWLAVVVAASVVAVAVPFAAIVLVTFASRREEAAHSLSRQAPGAVAQAARRLLAFRSDVDRPGIDTADPRVREVRFGHASRTLSDPYQYAAGRQSEPSSVRIDQRQGAGV